MRRRSRNRRSGGASNASADHPRHSPDAVPLGGCSGYQAGTAFGAARGKHLTTIAGRHTRTESVGSRPLETAGLKGSFHGIDP